jgi:polar amino acid transport system substrate-binding protein
MRWSLLSFSLIVGVQWAVPPISAFAADLETIRARGYLVVAVREGWRPLSFREPSGQLTGLEIDLAHQLAHWVVGDAEAVVFEVVSNQERLPAVLEDRADVAIAGLTITPERMRLVNFSPPYYLDGVGFLVRHGEVTRLQDLQRRRVGLLQDSSTIPSVRYVLPQANLVPLTSYLDGFNHLSGRQIDAFAGDVTVLVGWQQEHGGYDLLPTLASAEPLAIALPKGVQYNDLRTLVHNALTTWHDSGWLEERTTFWGLP